MEDVKSILVASERLFGCESDPSETMKQTRIVTEVRGISAALFAIICRLMYSIFAQMCGTFAGGFLCTAEFYPDLECDQTPTTPVNVWNNAAVGQATITSVFSVCALTLTMLCEFRIRLWQK